MLHPSYTDLMRTINSEVEEGDTPVVNSRYSIVLAAAKRARQLIAGEDAYVNSRGKKPLIHCCRGDRKRICHHRAGEQRRGRTGSGRGESRRNCRKLNKYPIGERKCW